MAEGGGAPPAPPAKEPWRAPAPAVGAGPNAQTNQYGRAYDFLKKHPYRIRETFNVQKLLHHSGFGKVPMTALALYAVFVSYQLRSKVRRPPMNPTAARSCRSRGRRCAGVRPRLAAAAEVLRVRAQPRAQHHEHL